MDKLAIPYMKAFDAEDEVAETHSSRGPKQAGSSTKLAPVENVQCQIDTERELSFFQNSDFRNDSSCDKGSFEWWRKLSPKDERFIEAGQKWRLDKAQRS